MTNKTWRVGVAGLGMLGAGLATGAAAQKDVEKLNESDLDYQTQFDDIDDVGLYLTRDRQRLSATTVSDVRELSYAVYSQTGFRLADWARVSVGARFDVFDIEVDNASDAANRFPQPRKRLYAPRRRWIISLAREQSQVLRMPNSALVLSATPAMPPSRSPPPRTRL